MLWVGLRIGGAFLTAATTATFFAMCLGPDMRSEHSSYSRHLCPGVGLGRNTNFTRGPSEKATSLSNLNGGYTEYFSLRSTWRLVIVRSVWPQHPLKSKGVQSVLYQDQGSCVSKRVGVAADTQLPSDSP